MANNNKIKIIFIISTMMLIITSCVFIIQKNPTKKSYATESTQKQLSAIIKIDDNEYNFDNVDSINMEYEKTLPKEYDVNVKINNLPTTATNIKLLINMPIGMKYIIDGSENEQLKKFLNSDINKTPNDSIWGYQNENTGKREYSIIDNTTDITIPIKVTLDEVVFANKIDNAIKVTLTYTNDETQHEINTNLKNIKVNYNGEDEIFWYENIRNYTVKKGETYALKNLGINSSSKTWSYSFVNGSSYPGQKKLAREIELQLTVNLKHKDTNIPDEDITDSTIIGLDSDYTQCNDNNKTNCWKIEKLSNDNGKKYYSIKKIETNTSGIYGISWNITIPDTCESEDQIVVTGKAIYTYYGGNYNSNLIKSEKVTKDSTFTRTFTIVNDNQHVWANCNSNDLDCKKNKIIGNKNNLINSEIDNENLKLLSTLGLGNLGGSDSNPKTIELNFYDKDIVKVRSISINTINEVMSNDEEKFNLMLKINNSTDWKKAIILNSNDEPIKITNDINYYYYQFCIVNEDGSCKRLENTDTINAIKYDIGSIPSLFEKYIYVYGLILKTTDDKYENGADHTIEVYDKGSTDNNHLNSTGIGHNYIRTDGTYSTMGLEKINNISSMAGDEIEVNYRISGNDSSGAYLTMRVNSYIREIFGHIDKESIKLVNSRGYDLTNDVIITEFRDKDGINVYKINTSKIVGNAACLYCRVLLNESTIVSNTYLTLSYKIKTNITDNGGTYYYKDMIFLESANKEYDVISYNSNRTIYSKDSAIYERFNVDSNNINLKSIVGTGTNDLNKFIEVKTKSDILMTNELKINGETITWDKTETNIPKINSNKAFSVIEKIINNSGTLSGKDSVIYIPIPKEGDNFGELSNNEAFKWTTKLINEISNNDKLNISYGIITPSGIYEDINSQSNKFENYNELNKANYNCIKIVLKENLDINETINIEIPLISEVDEENQNEIIKFESIYYRNLTNKDNEKYAGVTTGELVGLKLYDESKIIIKYQDENGNKLLEDEEKIQQVGTNYELDEIKEIENYNLKKIEGNPTGKYMLDDIEIIYIYELEEKEVIVHYYKENTTEKLTEDGIVKGKVTTKEEIEAVDIPNYDLVSEEKQKVEFGEDTEIIFYYKKQKGKKVMLEYVDEENNYIKDSESICEEKELGASCNINCSEIADYTLLTNPKDYSIEITKEEQATQCKYKLNNGEGVIIKYFDENNEELSKEENTCINQKLKSECIVECKKIEGYTIETKDKYTFKITKEKQEQVCKYKKIEEKEEEPQQPEEKKEEKQINPATGIKDIILITMSLLSIGSIIYIKKKRVY